LRHAPSGIHPTTMVADFPSVVPGAGSPQATLNDSLMPALRWLDRVQKNSRSPTGALIVTNSVFRAAIASAIRRLGSLIVTVCPIESTFSSATTRSVLAGIWD
jgi:hypothetical protein